MSELRWNPLLGEWLVTATHRQERTFFPPADFCPLCPTKDPNVPTEIPENNYDIVVFENRFPSIQQEPEKPAIESANLFTVKPARGVCEVVVYSPNHYLSLAQESIEQIHKLILVWTDRFQELGALDFVKCVFVFENKGESIGVTLHHPHGQIYAYPFIPPRIARELEQSEAHWKKLRKCLICEITAEEMQTGSRIITSNESFAAFIPFFARWPYEVHITSRRHLQALTDLNAEEQLDLARTLKAVLAGYDKLFDLSFPYMMVMHQRPSDGPSYEYYHFHIEFYPPLRSASRFKHLAGSETGAGMFINDTLPEEKAAELRAAIARTS